MTWDSDEEKMVMIWYDDGCGLMTKPPSPMTTRGQRKRKRKGY